MEADRYPRISQAQLEIWLDSPVTKVYLQSLQWSADQIREVLGKGGFINSSNSDLTFSGIHSALGEIKGLEEAGGVLEESGEDYRKERVINLLNKYQMIKGDSIDQDI